MKIVAHITLTWNLPEEMENMSDEEIHALIIKENARLVAESNAIESVEIHSIQVTR